MKQLKTACSKAAACVRGYLVERAKRITMEQELTMNRKYGWMRKDTVIAKSLVQPM